MLKNYTCTYLVLKTYKNKTLISITDRIMVCTVNARRPSNETTTN